MRDYTKDYPQDTERKHVRKPYRLFVIRSNAVEYITVEGQGVPWMAESWIDVPR